MAPTKKQLKKQLRLVEKETEQRKAIPVNCFSLLAPSCRLLLVLMLLKGKYKDKARTRREKESSKPQSHQRNEKEEAA